MGNHDPDVSPPAKSELVDQLMPLVYDELKRLAGRYLRSEGDRLTLQPTSLVHEAYLRLTSQRRGAFADRAHFFRTAAQMMRRVLIDYCRARLAVKRGGAELRVTLVDSNLEPTAGPDVDLLALDRALDQLAALDPQQATIVELRFFAGLTVEETAQTLGLSPATVKRDWALARAFLVVELEGKSRIDGA